MRRYRTEREVYKKLKILERHSAFKKPYYNFPGAHPIGELLYSGRGWPRTDPIGAPWSPPAQDPWGGPGGCQLACTGGMLDCEGGCDTINCICNDGAIQGQIIQDPSGAATLEEIAPNQLLVCIPNTKGLKDDYPEVHVAISDGRSGGDLSWWDPRDGGYTTYEQQQAGVITIHPMINCEDCCESFNLTGDDTVDPGDEWIGTVDPPCPGATVTVAGVGENCGPTSGTIDPSGTTVTVQTISTHCGEFLVTVNYTDPQCTTLEATRAVRINNTGANGGSWGNSTTCCDHAVFCYNCCDFPGQQCNVGGCQAWRSAGASQDVCPDPCNAWFRIGEDNGGPCADDIQVRPCSIHPTQPDDFPNDGCIPYGTPSGSCTGSYEYIYDYQVCTWRCSC